MENKMKSSLKIGFLLNRWGIDCFWGALTFTIGWIVIDIMLSASVDYMGISALVLVGIGMILFFIGRVIVGLQSRKVNFTTNRPRTEIEQWFLNEMLGIEDVAIQKNLANQVAKIIPGAADNIFIASNSTGLISHYSKVGKVFTGNNFILNRFVLIASVLYVVIIAIINLI